MNEDKSQSGQLHISVFTPKFDIEREDFYEYNKPKERTKKRLNEIAECGMEEVEMGSFGYKGLTSDLYIEKIWRYSDEEFRDYMIWANQIRSNKQKDIIPRYFTDIRCGCAAVRDKLHASYNKDYQGLNNDTPDVVEYKHGYKADGAWNMKQEDIDYLNQLCERLNNESLG